MEIYSPFREEAQKLLKRYYHRLIPLLGIRENNAWHKEDDCHLHTMRVFNELLKAMELPFITDVVWKGTVRSYLNAAPLHSSVSRRELLMVATLLHDIAKPETLQVANGITSCPKHEATGALKAWNFLHSYQDFERKWICYIIRHHASPHLVFAPDKGRRAIWDEFNELHEGFAYPLALLGRADCLGSQLPELDPMDWLIRDAKYLEYLNQPYQR